MWIPFGLIGLMPISLLVFANPNQGVEKQSAVFDTTLQKFLNAVNTLNKILTTHNRILTTALDSNANGEKVKTITKFLFSRIFILIVLKFFTGWYI